MYALLNSIHRKLARSPLATRLAVLVRNQALCVIRYHLGEDANYLVNGESWLIDTVAPHCASFIDIGANQGYWSEAFLAKMRPGARGLLIDAAGPAVEMLRQRFADRPAIEVVHAAVSDTVGELEFFEEPSAGESSSLVAGFSAGGARRVVVPATTIDAELARLGLASCDFVKIDAEGYDLHVLHGAKGALARQAIGALQFEYNSPWAQAGSTLADAFQFLERSGYRVYLLQSSGLRLLNYRRYGEYFGYSNYVAVSPAWQQRLQPASTELV